MKYAFGVVCKILCLTLSPPNFLLYLGNFIVLDVKFRSLMHFEFFLSFFDMVQYMDESYFLFVIWEYLLVPTPFMKQLSFLH